MERLIRWLIIILCTHVHVGFCMFTCSRVNVNSCMMHTQLLASSPDPFPAFNMHHWKVGNGSWVTSNWLFPLTGCVLMCRLWSYPRRPTPPTSTGSQRLGWGVKSSQTSRTCLSWLAQMVCMESTPTPSPPPHTPTLSLSLSPSLLPFPSASASLFVHPHAFAHFMLHWHLCTCTYTTH